MEDSDCMVIEESQNGTRVNYRENPVRGNERGERKCVKKGLGFDTLHFYGKWFVSLTGMT